MATPGDLPTPASIEAGATPLVVDNLPAGPLPSSTTSPWTEAARFLARHLSNRHARRLDSLPDAIAWSWATSTLTTYRSRISALGDLAAALAPHATAGLVVEQFLLQQLGDGSPAASLRVTLSAATLLHTLGFLPEAPERRLWRLSTAALRLHELEPDNRRWLCPSDILEAARRATSPSHWQSLAVIIVALSLGLRISEAASLSPSAFQLCQGPLAPSVTFNGGKTRPGQVHIFTRHPPPYVMLWAACLDILCPEQPHDTPYCSAAQLRCAIADLFPSGYTFHAVRRGCARGMFQAGCQLGDIMQWIRWSDRRTALHYIGTPPPNDLNAWTLPLPPTRGSALLTTWGGPRDIWPAPVGAPRLDPIPDASAKRRRNN